MSSDPNYGLAYVQRVLEACDAKLRWTYLSEDGVAHGISREELSAYCRECDLYINLSGVNWIPELEQCRRRVLVDTDPVFTQIGAHGISGPFSWYDVLFTFGECVHSSLSSMPTAGARWHPTRQPIVLERWPVRPANRFAHFTTVVSWSAYGDHEYQGRWFGQKDREFEPFFTFPKELGLPMTIAVNGPEDVKQRLAEGGWGVAEPKEITRDPWTYQQFITGSRAEFCVAKHGYVSTKCGWFSDRSSAYLAMGRPVILQDTGFSRVLPCGTGLLSFQTKADAAANLLGVNSAFEDHCRGARHIAETFFDARLVLSELLARSI
jgi:hypothetical protein